MTSPSRLILFCSAVLLGSIWNPVAANQANSTTITVRGQRPGPTVFISKVDLGVTAIDSLTSIRFTIAPKTRSVTRPVSATYALGYLKSRGYVDSADGQITIPVFGLYADYSNTVRLTYSFDDGSSSSENVTVTTPAYADPCGFNNPTVLQPRTTSTALSYDYIMVRSACSADTPVVIDTDGAVRWVGTGGMATYSSLFFKNAVYIAGDYPNPTLRRVELDGTVSLLADYSSHTAFYLHHNIDPGKTGMIVEWDTSTQVESEMAEVDTEGKVLKVWNFAEIIGAAMRAGGDDPTQFIKPQPGVTPAQYPRDDWFHMNAVTYRKSDDSLIVSAREDFVICIDYESKAIKWILGDTTKRWYQFPSLQKYALALGAGTLPPIGQHSVSITHDDHLLLLDNGTASHHHTPAGASRRNAMARKYTLDLEKRVATEVFSYPKEETVYSPYCSSVYEDAPGNYLIDYAIVGGPTTGARAELRGLDASGALAFHYSYPTRNCDTAYNSIPVHFENLIFSGPPSPPVFTSAPAPSQVIAGTPYTHTFRAKGEPAPTFTISSGTLPPGLALSPSGVLSGTATNAGSYRNITVTATNGVSPAAQQLFSLEVVTRASNYMAAHGLSGDDAALSYDYDKDGIANVAEYAFGLNPASASTAGLPIAGRKNYAGTDYLSLTFTRSAFATDLTYLVEASSDLEAWTEIARSAGGAATTGPGFVSESGSGSAISVEVRDTVPMSGTAARFMRVKISAP